MTICKFLDKFGNKTPHFHSTYITFRRVVDWIYRSYVTFQDTLLRTSFHSVGLGSSFPTARKERFVTGDIEKRRGLSAAGAFTTSSPTVSSSSSSSSSIHSSSSYICHVALAPIHFVCFRSFFHFFPFFPPLW